MTGYRGRFAPSPTGDLHLGSALAVVAAWLRCRTRGGAFVLRVEDLDAPRVIRGCESEQLDDLRWLGIDWEEGPDVGGSRGPYRQSERLALYDAAVESLANQGLVYLCDCSRKEIASVASAPHVGEEGPRYAGTCRSYGMTQRTFRRPPAIRLAVPPGAVSIVDAVQGELHQDVAVEVGDFVLRRGDGVYAYQLAVVVDDLAMGITEVVRGADLLSSAPRQAMLAKLLGGTPPEFAHVPLLLDWTGARLAKRDPRLTLRGLRAAGSSPDALVTMLARALGLRMNLPSGAPVSLGDLVRCSDGSMPARREVCLDAAELAKLASR